MSLKKNKLNSLLNCFQVNVSLQPTSFQRSDDVTIINTNYKHTFNRNAFEFEDQVMLLHLSFYNEGGRATMGRNWEKCASKSWQAWILVQPLTWLISLSGTTRKGEDRFPD